MNSVKEYNGPRESAGIVDHAFQTLEAAGVPLNIPQLTSQKALDSACGVGKICAIIFLPHIYDSSAKIREAYISTIAEAAKSVRGTPFSFFWSEGGAQESLEGSLNINNAYPTLSVLSIEKKVFAVQKVSWSAKNVKAFLNGIISGRHVQNPPYRTVFTFYYYMIVCNMLYVLYNHFFLFSFYL